MSIPGTLELFRQSWRMYRTNIRAIIVFQFVTLIITLGGFLLMFLASGSTILGLFIRAFGVQPLLGYLVSTGIILCFILTGFVLTAWASVAQFLFFGMVSQGSGAMATPRRALRDAVSVGVRLLVVGVLQVGITILGFLLFIVPGIFIGIRLAPAMFIAAEGKGSGLDALRKSWVMTRGVSWAILARYEVLFFLTFFFFLINLIPIIGVFVVSPFLVFPLLNIWSWNFYGALRDRKRDMQYPLWKRISFGVIAGALLVFIIGSTAIGLREKEDEARRAALLRRTLYTNSYLEYDATRDGPRGGVQWLTE